MEVWTLLSIVSKKLMEVPAMVHSSTESPVVLGWILQFSYQGLFHVHAALRVSNSNDWVMIANALRMVKNCKYFRRSRPSEAGNSLLVWYWTRVRKTTFASSEIKTITKKIWFSQNNEVRYVMVGPFSLVHLAAEGAREEGQLRMRRWWMSMGVIRYSWRASEMRTMF